MSGVLAELGLAAVNPGTWSGHDGWLADPNAPLVQSFNPATGDEFGYSAASTRGFSLIGAPFSDITGLNSGKARLLTTP